MAVIPVTQVTLAGVAPPAGAAAAAGGDTVANDGRTYITIVNSSGANRTVTFDSVQPCDQGFDHNTSLLIATGQTRRFGPFPVARFGNPIAVTYDNATGLTIAAERI